MSQWQMQQIDQQKWNQTTTPIVNENLLQSWEYGVSQCATSNCTPLHFSLEDDAGQLRGRVQCLLRKLPLLGGVVRINRGPVLGTNQDATENLVPFLTALKQTARRQRWWYIRLAPDVEDSTQARTILHQAGFKPRLAPAWGSVRLDLSLSTEDLRKGLKGKWRNLLRKAEKLNLSYINGLEPDRLDTLIKSYNNFIQQKNFTGLSVDLIKHLSDQSGHSWRFNLFTAHSENDTQHAVGTLVSVGHGDTATYLIGFTDDEGRRLQANYLLLWQSILAAKHEGRRWYDLGGLNSETPKGVAHFKSGVGGKPYTLVGEWHWGLLWP